MPPKHSKPEEQSADRGNPLQKGDLLNSVSRKAAPQSLSVKLFAIGRVGLCLAFDLRSGRRPWRASFPNVLICHHTVSAC